VTKRLWDQVPFAQVPTWILAPRIADDGCELRLGGPDLRVFVAIAARYNHRRDEPAFPSLETLAGDTGMHVRDVRASVRRLVEWGAIELGRRAGRRQVNAYFVRQEPGTYARGMPAHPCWKRHRPARGMPAPNREQALANQESTTTDGVGVGDVPGVEDLGAARARILARFPDATEVDA